MADYFDFIKKPTNNATANPPTGNDKSPTSAQATVGKQMTNDKTVSPVVPPVNPPSLTNGQAKKDIVNPPTGSSTTNNLDLMTHLTQRSNRVMMAAQTKAKELKSDLVDSEHLLFALTTDSEIYNLLVESKIQPTLITDELAKIYKRGTVDRVVQFSPRIKKILNDALVVARKLGFEFIAPEHLLLSLYEEGEGVGARILVKLGLNKEEINKKVVGKKEGLTEEEKKAQNKKKALEQFTIDLTAKASQGLLDAVVERSAVIERVIHILSRRTKNNPSLVGEAGVGKTAIVEGLAEKIVAKEVPEPLLNKRILQLDLMSMLAGASHRGEFEERMKDLIEEVKASQGQIILFIDEIHNIVGAGSSGEGSLDASNFLKPALARGEIQIVGATTLTEYRKYIEKDPALERRFQPVLVPEPTEEQGIKMLKAIKDKYEAFHRVKIPDDAIEAAVILSKRYVGDRFLPDKAVDLIDEAASAVRLPLISLPEEIKSLETRIAQLSQELKESEKKADKVKSRILRSKIDEISSGLNEKKEEFNVKKSQSTGAVTVEIIKDIIARWTGIPVAKITSSETERLAHLEDIIHKRLIDQEGAVTSVSQAVRRGRAGLKSAARPIGSFIFLGPTGVGKTELAKALADILFGSEDLMIRFDMTEYMEKHEVAKLLGAPPGYVGYEEGGKLTEQVRRKPYSVVLFDEVEKAHPEIFNILLQILDDGRLTDNRGHVVSFKNTVVICTSNLGTKLIQDELLKGAKTSAKVGVGRDRPAQKSKVEDEKDKNKFKGIKGKVMVELTKFFKPELINRFDEVIVFEPLRFQDMIEIVKLQ
ncbi:MAG: ATP-dependent Clp protease ATP-binding subunit, partial [Patescibacteria group bacterium]